MLGKQPNSTLPSAPEYGFGTAERPGPASIDKAGQGSPGPVYFPKKGSGGHPSAPSHSFGVSHRYSQGAQKHLGTPMPGPGQYSLGGAFNAQQSSERFEAETWKFGTATRGHMAKVYVSAEHAKSVAEFIDSPGPCAYKQGGSFGDQKDSRKPSSAAFGLGTSERFYYGGQLANGIAKPSMPGPGSYQLNASHGRQLLSEKTTLPINSFPKADRDRTAAAVYLGPKHQALPYRADTAKPRPTAPHLAAEPHAARRAGLRPRLAWSGRVHLAGLRRYAGFVRAAERVPRRLRHRRPLRRRQIERHARPRRLLCLSAGACESRPSAHNPRPTALSNNLSATDAVLTVSRCYYCTTGSTA